MRGETTELVIPWNGQEIRWTDFTIPVCLREWEDRLYLITFDRDTDFEQPRLKYFQQNLTGDGFETIEPAAFPKRIATQNMWFRRENWSIGMDGQTIYEEELARRLDPDDVYFSHSLTARIWVQLETGREYYESNGMPLAEIQPILRKFATTHDPIRLTKIVEWTRDNDESAAGGEAAIP